MERLYNEWARVLDNQATRLEVEAVAAGRPGRRHLGLAAHRLATRGDAHRGRARPARPRRSTCSLSGELVGGSARSRIRVLCKGRSELRMSVSPAGGQGRRKATILKSVLRTWRFPFTLEIEPLAGAEPATLGAAAGPDADHRRAGRRVRPARPRRRRRPAVVLRVARRAGDDRQRDRRSGARSAPAGRARSFRRCRWSTGAPAENARRAR